MNVPYEKFAVVWAWKLHTDTGKHIPELLPKYIKDGNGRILEEIRYFNVEGKKRPAIVWTSNTATTRLIMLTTQGSHYVTKLGSVLENGEVSHFDPDKRQWPWYPNQLIESEAHPLSDDLRQLLYEELNAFEMTVQPTSKRTESAFRTSPK